METWTVTGPQDLFDFHSSFFKKSNVFDGIQTVDPWCLERLSHQRSPGSTMARVLSLSSILFQGQCRDFLAALPPTVPFPFLSSAQQQQQQLRNNSTTTPAATGAAAIRKKSVETTTTQHHF